MDATYGAPAPQGTDFGDFADFVRAVAQAAAASQAPSQGGGFAPYGGGGGGAFSEPRGEPRFSWLDEPPAQPAYPGDRLIGQANLNAGMAADQGAPFIHTTFGQQPPPAGPSEQGSLPVPMGAGPAPAGGLPPYMPGAGMAPDADQILGPGARPLSPAGAPPTAAGGLPPYMPGIGMAPDTTLIPGVPGPAPGSGPQPTPSQPSSDGGLPAGGGLSPDSRLLVPGLAASATSGALAGGGARNFDPKQGGMVRLSQADIANLAGGPADPRDPRAVAPTAAFAQLGRGFSGYGYNHPIRPEDLARARPRLTDPNAPLLPIGGQPGGAGSPGPSAPAGNAGATGALGPGGNFQPGGAARPSVLDAAGNDPTAEILSTLSRMSADPNLPPAAQGALNTIIRGVTAGNPQAIQQAQQLIQAAQGAQGTSRPAVPGAAPATPPASGARPAVPGAAAPSAPPIIGGTASTAEAAELDLPPGVAGPGMRPASPAPAPGGSTAFPAPGPGVPGAGSGPVGRSLPGGNVAIPPDSAAAPPAGAAPPGAAPWGFYDSSRRAVQPTLDDQGNVTGARGGVGPIFDENGAQIWPRPGQITPPMDENRIDGQITMDEAGILSALSDPEFFVPEWATPEAARAIFRASVENNIDPAAVLGIAAREGGGRFGGVQTSGNNPGNIRDTRGLYGQTRGTVPGPDYSPSPFAAYVDVPTGFAAIANLLGQDRNYVKAGNNTYAKMGVIYGPPDDYNDVNWGQQAGAKASAIRNKHQRYPGR